MLLCGLHNHNHSHYRLLWIACTLEVIAQVVYSLDWNFETSDWNTFQKIFFKFQTLIIRNITSCFFLWFLKHVRNVAEIDQEREGGPGGQSPALQGVSSSFNSEWLDQHLGMCLSSGPNAHSMNFQLSTWSHTTTKTESQHEFLQVALLTQLLLPDCLSESSS